MVNSWWIREDRFDLWFKLIRCVYFYSTTSLCADLCWKSQGCSTCSCHRSLFEKPSLASLSPCITSDENHDWSSVGILKGLQLGVHGSVCSFPLCMRASTGVLNPSSIQLSLTWLLDWPCWPTHIVCKGEAEEEEIRKKWEQCGLFKSICMCERDTQKIQWAFKIQCYTERPKCLQAKLKLCFLWICHLSCISFASNQKKKTKKTFSALK